MTCNCGAIRPVSRGPSDDGSGPRSRCQMVELPNGALCFAHSIDADLPHPVGQRDHVGSVAAIAHRTAMTRLNYDSTGEPGANMKQERGDHLGSRTVLARVIGRDYRPPARSR
jgi:hypothetical protein